MGNSDEEKPRLEPVNRPNGYRIYPPPRIPPPPEISVKKAVVKGGGAFALSLACNLFIANLTRKWKERKSK